MHWKACSYVCVGKPVSISTSRCLFLYLHQDACSHVKPVSILILGCLFPYMCWKSCFPFEFQDACSHSYVGMPNLMYVSESLFPFQFQDAYPYSCVKMPVPIYPSKACVHFNFGGSSHRYVEMPVPMYALKACSHFNSGCLFPYMGRKHVQF